MRFSQSTHLLMFLSLETKHKNWLRPQSVNYLVRISFAIRNGAGRWVEAKKKFRFFEKKTCIWPDGYLLLNRCSFNHQCISKIKVKKCFYPFISMFIFLYYLQDFSQVLRGALQNLMGGFFIIIFFIYS